MTYFPFQLAINLSSYGIIFGYSMIAFASVFLITGITLTVTKKWVRRTPEDEDILTN